MHTSLLMLSILNNQKEFHYYTNHEGKTYLMKQLTFIVNIS